MASIIGLLSFALLVSLPFAAIPKVGLFGNFDTNLSLFPFLLLLPLVFLRGDVPRLFLRRGSDGSIMRAFMFVMIMTSFMTLWNGWRFSGMGYAIYGQDPLGKASATFIVPVFLLLVIATVASIGERLPTTALQRALRMGFGLTVAYVAVQFVSATLPNPLYDVLRRFFEVTSKETTSASYFQLFGRLNGPTLEPAELSKLMVVFFLPWIAFPVSERLSMVRLSLMAVVVLGSQSLMGIATLGLVVILLLISGQINANGKLGIIALLGVGTLSIVIFGGELITALAERLSNLEQDASGLIRATYGLAALSIISEHPLAGVGWSLEIFFFPEKIASVSYLWEVQENLRTGEALSPKSLALRLAMYMGLPLFCFMVIWIAIALMRPDTGTDKRNLSRTRLAFALFAVSGSLDGGIITSFYMWAAIALPLGFQMRRNEIQ